MIKLIACDCDETLLDENHVCSEQNKQVILNLKQHGIHFVLSTGRSVDSITSNLQELNLDQKGDYAIGFNGGVIYDVGEHRIIKQKGISFEQVQRFYDFGMNYEVSIQIYTFDRIYANRISDQKMQAIIDRGMQIERYEEIETLAHLDIIKMVFVKEDMDYLMHVGEQMKPICGDVQISYSSNRFLEINALHTSKGEALLDLAAYLGYTSNECMAIGDNLNDLSMITMASIGCCVENARDEVKLASDYVSPYTHNQSAVADILKHYQLGDNHE